MGGRGSRGRALPQPGRENGRPDQPTPIDQVGRPDRADPAGPGREPQDKPTPRTTGEIQTRIREIYADLVAHGSHPWVHLTDVRDALGDLPKADVDRALEGLLDDENIVIDPEVHRHTLGEREHAAAVWIGGEWRHRLWINPGR